MFQYYMLQFLNITMLHDSILYITKKFKAIYVFIEGTHFYWVHKFLITCFQYAFFYINIFIIDYDFYLDHQNNA